MIKVENDMLVLDSSFTKEDVEAINYFVDRAVVAERERIINLIEKQGTWEASIHIGGKTIDDLVELIRNSK